MHLNTKKILSLLVVFSFTFSIVISQNKEYKVAAIGFYNFENLFDTLDTPDKSDLEFTPEGSKKYNTKVYLDKLDKLSFVVEKLGKDLTPDGLAILGIAEIENRSVLEDFVKHPLIVDRKYQIVHYESPDFRGIDVALIYNPKYFEVTHSEPLEVTYLREDSTNYLTRDILYVAGLFDGEPMHVFVNHWPSRRGGAVASSPKRELAASVAKAKIDSITSMNPNAKIVLMGDLNDDPVNPSVRKVLGAQASTKRVKDGALFNPFYDYYKKGIGTLAYQDVWNLFDQIIISSGMIDESSKGFRFYKAKVFNESFLYQKTGRWKGYPFRSFSFDDYQEGYSDHFPTYIYLIKEVN